MSQGKGTISSNDLMQKLVNAKKVMNKVDGGNYERGHVNEEMLRSNSEDLMNSQDLPQQSSTKQMGMPSVDKIQNSKLPDAIKRAMIENPIPQISLNEFYVNYYDEYKSDNVKAVEYYKLKEKLVYSLIIVIIVGSIFYLYDK